MLFFGSSYDPEREIPDLAGKVAIVTGANRGIGYETVKRLTTHGAKVYLGTRSEERGNEAIPRPRQERAVRPGPAELLLMDLNSLKDAKRAAGDFLTKENRLDILINNAAQGSINERIVTMEGLVNGLATNHFGQFVFTITLPLLEATSKTPGSDVRIVNVASAAYRGAPQLHQITSLKHCEPRTALFSPS